jgi:hypothetical protein
VLRLEFQVFDINNAVLLGTAAVADGKEKVRATETTAAGLAAIHQKFVASLFQRPQVAGRKFLRLRALSPSQGSPGKNSEVQRSAGAA